jgi:hypothetical protein
VEKLLVVAPVDQGDILDPGGTPGPKSLPLAPLKGREEENGREDRG